MIIDRAGCAAVEAGFPAQPVLIDGLVGWFSPGMSRRGVLLCGTYGMEQLNAYRSWRTLAERIAGAGCPTLRFDYAGQGDSSDCDEPGSVASMLDGIRRGIRFLRERAGAQEIVLVGLRLGATLAARAARDEEIARLVLLAPFTTGSAYLREMTLQAGLVDRLPDGTPLPQEPGTLSLGGFRLGSAALGELAALDLADADGRCPAPEILMLGTKTRALAERYRAMGAAVTVGAFPELARLVSDPLFASYPEESFATAAAFAVTGAGPHPAPPWLPALEPAPLHGEGWCETISAFGQGLVGLACRPRVVEPGAPTVILINSGLNVRSGYGRQTTGLARQLAGLGVASFRFDPRGIGDSADRGDGVSPFYAADAAADVRAALDHLAGAGPFVILGGCSGAYLAFNALCADDRLRAALLVNLQCFDLSPGTDIETMVRDSFRTEVSYAARARQGAFWRRIRSGAITPRAILGALGRDGLALARRIAAKVPGLSRRSRVVARKLAGLRRRGSRLRLVYSAGDRGLRALATDLGARPARRLGRPPVILDDTDHNLSPPAIQDRLFAILREVVCEVRDEVRGEAGDRLAPSFGR